MTFVEAFVEHYRAVHQTLLSEIGVMSDEAINRIPCEGANSTAVLEYNGFGFVPRFWRFWSHLGPPLDLGRGLA